jgi:hypothetical protein
MVARSIVFPSAQISGDDVHVDAVLNRLAVVTVVIAIQITRQNSGSCGTGGFRLAQIGKHHATPSMLIRRRLRCTPQRYPEIEPSDFTTRWQGTATAMRFAAQAAPTSWAVAVIGKLCAIAL